MIGYWMMHIHMMLNAGGLCDVWMLHIHIMLNDDGLCAI